MRKRNIYKQRIGRGDTTKRGVSSGSTLFANINTPLVMVGYKNVYDQALIHFAQLVTSHQRVMPTSSQILSKINIGSMHTF